MNLRSLKITLWIIGIASLLWTGWSLNERRGLGRYQVVDYRAIFPYPVLARLDTRTGEISLFVHDPQDHKVKPLDLFLRETQK